jgi:hypothetical protein
VAQRWSRDLAECRDWPWPTSADWSRVDEFAESRRQLTDAFNEFLAEIRRHGVRYISDMEVKVRSDDVPRLPEPTVVRRDRPDQGSTAAAARRRSGSADGRRTPGFFRWISRDGAAPAVGHERVARENPASSDNRKRRTGPISSVASPSRLRALSVGLSVWPLLGHPHPSMASGAFTITSHRSSFRRRLPR